MSTFFEEQARHRRRTVRFAVFSLLAIGLTGIPVSLILTPVLYLVVLITAHVIQLITPLPAGFWQAVNSAGYLIPTALDPVDQGLNAGDWSGIPWVALARLGLVLVAPGVLAMLLLWVWVRALVWHAGSGGVLLSIGAREPNPKDLEEKQLVNLIEEMAIAAGMAPPAVRILDRPEPNAAAVGRDPRQATIVVTRGLLDQLDRDQTQGILAHAMATIANGDLRIAMLLLSVNQTFGLLSAILHAGSARRARQVLFASIRGLIVRDDQGAARLAAMLAQEEFDTGTASGREGCFAILRLPFQLAAATITFQVALGQFLLFGPWLAAMWRARRYLADASAVRLTRNPQGIASGLQVLGRHRVSFEDGNPSGFFFVHWPDAGGRAATMTPIGGWHPTLARRLNRLARVGARIQRTVSGVRWQFSPVGIFLGLLTVVMYVTMVAATVLMLGTAVFTTVMTLFFTGAALYFVHGFFEVLPGLIHWIRFDAADFFGDLVAAIRRLRAGAGSA